ncbi:hypothetical protein N7478_011514 [Penicillium angulare]|uniref:uncharacterized protein n=1 Tax=Penicillium angulare TaxID=116970 RepID=UPI0025426848|nr:uncharacterized protein N7478_011514 [Penicillium angulare]KAJ5263909.1 hypothetical protein N7478_011514 [Penicillium angulare]
MTAYIETRSKNVFGAGEICAWDEINTEAGEDIVGKCVGQSFPDDGRCGTTFHIDPSTGDKVASWCLMIREV